MALTKIITDGITDDAVTEAKLANAINTARAANTAKTGLGTNAVQTSHIADEQITLAKLEHGTSSNDGKFLRANNGADPTFETIDLTALSATNLTSGTVPDARFPATLPAASAANLTSIPAANITGTLPAISGANLTNLPGGGKILQVKQTKLTSAVSITGVTSYTNISGLSVDITPASTNNKILVMVQMQASNGGETIFKLQKSTSAATTDIGNSTAGAYTSFHGLFGNNARSGYYDLESIAFNFLEDDLQSTDQHTFKVQWSNITNITAYLNRTAYAATGNHYSYSGSSSITVMEVSA